MLHVYVTDLDDTFLMHSGRYTLDIIVTFDTGYTISFTPLNWTVGIAPSYKPLTLTMIEDTADWSRKLVTISVNVYDFVGVKYLLGIVAITDVVA